MDLMNHHTTPASKPLIGFPDSLIKNVSNQVVMVTGAGNDDGRALCLQLIQQKPAKLLLVDASEAALIQVFDEVNSASYKLVRDKVTPRKPLLLLPKVIPLLGSVNDELRMNDVVSTWHPTIIYHAAELSIEAIASQNVSECVKTNVLGTLTIAKVAIEQQVSRLFKITTGAATSPTSTLTASQLCSALILRCLATQKRPMLAPMWANMPAEEVACNTQFGLANVSPSSTSNKATCTTSVCDQKQRFVTPWDELQSTLQTLKIACECGDSELIQTIMTMLLPAYKPNAQTADLLHLEQLSDV